MSLTPEVLRSNELPELVILRLVLPKLKLLLFFKLISSWNVETPETFNCFANNVD